MYFAVGEHHDRADPLGRDIGEFGRDGLEELGAVDRRAIGSRADLDGAQFDVAEIAEALRQRLAHALGRRGAVGEGLAGALVDDHGDDGRQRLALFVEKYRPEQGEDERGQSGEAQQRPARPPQHQRRDRGETGDAEDGDQPERQQRREGERPVH